MKNRIPRWLKSSTAVLAALLLAMSPGIAQADWWNDEVEYDAQEANQWGDEFQDRPAWWDQAYQNDYDYEDSWWEDSWWENDGQERDWNVQYDDNDWWDNENQEQIGNYDYSYNDYYDENFDVVGDEEFTGDEDLDEEEIEAAREGQEWYDPSDWFDDNEYMDYGNV